MREQEQPNPVDISQLRDKLQSKSGSEYWRSLEQASETPEFKTWVKHEFPNEPEVWDRGTTRRDFLQLMGSMIALAGLAGCTRQPDEKIVPYVKQPEDQVPGRPLYFATSMTHNGFARGVLVESHMGRPTKIEGNPAHPDSLGAADVLTQSSVLDMYDPDRSKTILQNGSISTWSAFTAAAAWRLELQKSKQGEGLRILTGTVVSPTLASQLKNVLAQFPKAKWIQYSAVNRDNAREGAIRFFGADHAARYHIEHADLILALDSDFLNAGPGSIRYAREFANRRRARGGKVLKGQMNRLYSVESSPTITGTSADHHLPLASGRIEGFLTALAGRLGVPVKTNANEFNAEEKKWLDALAKDIKSRKGRSLIIAGDAQTPAVHALTHALNRTLGNAGKTVVYTEPIEIVSQDQTAAIRGLAADLAAGKVDDLFMLGVNPLYDAPSDLVFGEKMLRAGFRAHLGLYVDETAQLCHWHVNAAHYLESWGDARAFDLTAGVVQPIIHPLYEGKTAIDVAAVLEGRPGVSTYEIVRGYWKSQADHGADQNWDKNLHDGVIAGTAGAEKNPAPAASPNLKLTQRAATEGFEVNFRPDPTIGTGESANNAWLQELPKAITRVTWENIIAISPRTAEKLGITKGEIETLDAGGRYAKSSVISVEHDGQKLEGPSWIVPGHAEDSVTVYLGYGRTHAGKVSNEIGYNAYTLRTSGSPDFVSGAKITVTGKKVTVASTQDHGTMDGRNLVREATAAEYAKNSHFAQHLDHEPKANETLFTPAEHLKGENQWGMSIDLNTCIGCGACTIACQSENNIAVVGKKNVLNGREMHWIRVDRYFTGSADNPRVVHQPIPCMQCENAPCEPVCPVGATTHSEEGLNDMVYNRCVGTRYCANNCPYKVRRFNFYNFVNDAPTLKLLRNPDVTVRTRGVMEKCTYCVQRVNLARIDAKKEDRPIRDGEVVTACQQTCPTQAINFGNIKDPNAKVSRDKADTLNYGILTDLGTRPRTTYLARLRNPNPELEPAGAASHAETHHG